MSDTTATTPLTMISNARALQTKMVPQELHHREGAIDHLSSALSRVSSSDTAEHVVIYGPSGAGKTTLAKYVLGKLEAEAPDVRWGYVNCMANSTKRAVLAQLARDGGVGRDLPRDGISSAAFHDRIRDHDGQFIAVLDEVDLLDDTQVLLALADLPDVAIVTICLGEDEWLAGADERIRSRVRSAETIELSSYRHAELVDILEHRVAHGLHGTVTDPTIAEIADRAAGDARVAITLLRQAAKYVEDGQARTLTTQVVDAVADTTEVAMFEARERPIGAHQKALYKIIRETGSLKAGELHRQYEEQMDEPRDRSTRWRYLDRLEAYGLIETTGTGRGTRYHYCGGGG